MASIHHTAVIDPSAELGDDVEIGPYCVISGPVQVGRGTVLKSHVCLEGDLSLGEACTVFPFASLGGQTQDLKYRGGTPGVEIGDRTTIREYVTVNAATGDGDRTRVGSECLLMAYVHVAHDCRVGDDVIMANCATLAGHVVVEDHAIVGGLCGVHQFVRIGEMSMTGGCSKIIQDIPRFSLVDGNPLEVRGINRVGLQRRTTPAADMDELKKCHRIFYRSELTHSQAILEAERSAFQTDKAKAYVEFMKTSERGVT